MKSILKRWIRQYPILEHFVFFWVEIHVFLVDGYNRVLLKIWQQGQSDLKVNFGAVEAPKKDFLNLDFTKNADFRLDLRKPIPMDGGLCAMVYSEHFIEHLSYPEGAELHFSECFRLLKPGGIISISVPDTWWPLLEYVEGKKEYLLACEIHQWHPRELTTFMEHINHHFRQRARGMSYNHFENHRFAWDFDTLKSKLEAAGFTQIKERLFNPELDSIHREVGSLFVHAQKPMTMNHS